MYHIKTFFFGILGNFWFGGIFFNIYRCMVGGILCTIYVWHTLDYFGVVCYAPSMGGILRTIYWWIDGILRTIYVCVAFYVPSIYGLVLFYVPLRAIVIYALFFLCIYVLMIRSPCNPQEIFFSSKTGEIIIQQDPP